MNRKRILVADCFPPEILPALSEMGIAPIGETEVALLKGLHDNLDCEICFPADTGQPLPDSTSLRQFDGMLWSGTSLSVNDAVPGMQRQIELMQSAYNAGLPVFGICGGLQVGVVAAGGKVIRNPRGLQSPVARQIKIRREAMNHPMFQYRDLSFDAFCDHFDLVSRLPEGGEALAGNDSAAVQAAAFNVGQSELWGVQYHPDFGLEHFCAVSEYRRQDWIEHGLAGSDTDVDSYVSIARRLKNDPQDRAAANFLGIGKDLVDETVRRSEIRAWLTTKIL